METSIAHVGARPARRVRLIEHGGVEQFEITKPSLHDLFVRIARPTADDLRAEAATA